MALVRKALVAIMVILVSSKFLLDSHSKFCLLVSRPFRNYSSKPLCFHNLTEPPIEILEEIRKRKIKEEEEALLKEREGKTEL